MEKGLKNLTQADRSARKKQNDGSYHDHEDSGIGISDLDEESEDHHADMPNVSEAHFSAYPGVYPSQQRVPSIQSMLQPMQMQQPIIQQQQQQQTLQQHMQHPMHHMTYSSHHIAHSQ